VNVPNLVEIAPVAEYYSIIKIKQKALKGRAYLQPCYLKGLTKGRALR